LADVVLQVLRQTSATIAVIDSTQLSSESTKKLSEVKKKQKQKQKKIK